MSNNKFTLNPKDIDRLSTLMREEELRLDAQDPSDAELLAMEEALQQKLKKLAATQANETAAQLEEHLRLWQATEQRMLSSSSKQDIAKNAVPFTVPEEEPASLGAEIIPLHRPKLKWAAWGGALAAAALALMVVVPALQNEQRVDDAKFVIKGNGSAFSADCEYSVLQNDSGKIIPSADGMGYEGPVGSAFHFGLRCDESGFLNIVIEGKNTMELRNIALNAGESTKILHEGKLASFVLQSQAPWVISVLLSDRAIPSETALPRSETDTKSLLGITGLWFDRISVKGVEN